MKILIGLIAVVFLSTAEAKIPTFDPINEVIPATDLTPEMTKELIAGLYPNRAVEFKEGTSLPLRFFSNYRIFSVAYDPKLTIQVEMPCYLRFIKQKVYMSLDLATWEKPANFLKGQYESNIKISPDKSSVLVETNLIHSP